MKLRYLQVAACAGALFIASNNLSAAPQVQSTTLPWTEMNVLLEGLVAGTDYFTTPSYAAEYAQNPGYGQIFYIPSANTGGQTTLYREYTGYDHFDSTSYGEGGYTTEFALGYPYVSGSGINGLTQIARFINPSTGDHASAGISSTVTNYNLEGGFNAFGYVRYFNNEPMVTNQGGGITESADTRNGAAIVSWMYNGTEFLNSHDNGRDMQSDFIFYDLGQGAQGTSLNPTQAGDGAPAPNTHGSPTLENDIPNGVHVTRAVPLEFNCCTAAPSGFPGETLDPDHTFVYNNTQIGSNITLNFNGMGPVAQYETHFVVPAAIPGPGFQGEISTAYLQQQYNQFWEYDAASGLSTLINPGAMATTACSNNDIQYQPPSGYGGVIISDQAGDLAMGVYGLLSSVGGPVTYFQVNDLRDTSCGDPSTKWSAYQIGTGLSVGDNTFHTYVVTGTLQSVEADMRVLYMNGSK